MQIQFFKTSLNDAQQDRLRRMMKDLKAMPNSAYENVGSDEFCERIVAKYRFRETPMIHKEGIEREEPVFKTDNPNAAITVYIPFTGVAEDFQYFNRSSPVPCPVYEVEGSCLKKTFHIHRTRVDDLDSMVEKEIDALTAFFDEIRKSLPHFNRPFSDYSLQEFKSRHREMKANQESAAKIAESKFAVRKRNDGTEKVIVPVMRKPITVASAPTSKTSPVQEYAIELREYDDILSTISSMAKVMERSPTAFRDMKEEPLRTILLVALNGVYEGQATGETFNGEGKTDILIRRDDKNVFIAECLMWKGPKYLKGKMDDQIFKYAMWRDSKVALIVFNRGGSFSAAIEAMRKTVSTHPQCVRQTNWQHESGARYVFRRHDDAQREFLLTAIAFDVPSRNDAAT